MAPNHIVNGFDSITVAYMLTKYHELIGTNKFFAADQDDNSKVSLTKEALFLVHDAFSYLGSDYELDLTVTFENFAVDLKEFLTGNDSFAKREKFEKAITALFEDVKEKLELYS